MEAPGGVEHDEFDTGERMILNFGHTLGHAVEGYYNYSTYTHGCGVAVGMAMITKKFCSEEIYNKLIKKTIDFPKTHFENLDFSFSGIKTAVINLHHKNPDVSREDLCMSFEKAVTEVLIENITKAIEQTGIKKVVLAGGVSANTHIRSEFEKLEQKGIKVYKPLLKVCV